MTTHVYVLCNGTCHELFVALLKNFIFSFLCLMKWCLLGVEKPQLLLVDVNKFPSILTRVSFMLTFHSYGYVFIPGCVEFISVSNTRQKIVVAQQ